MAARPLVSKIVAAATALSVLGAALPAVSTPAAAKPIKIIKVVKVGHHHRHFYGPGLMIAGVVAAAAASSSSCYWLKVRALRTDSDYWWYRYNACIGE